MGIIILGRQIKSAHIWLSFREMNSEEQVQILEKAVCISLYTNYYYLFVIFL